MTTQSLSEDAIAERYRETYGLGAAYGFDHAQRHWVLERKLTAELLAANPDERWAVFSRCYTELYREISWLNTGDKGDQETGHFVQWLKLLPRGTKVFEVGSGTAALLKYLSSHGYQCTATEITTERGAKHAIGADGLQWRTTDGIHLAKFEPLGTYQVVISTGVIEHFHPDDLGTHFANAFRILTKGGRYIFTTPHASSGPHDLSRVFGEDAPICMHLKEYSVRELVRKLQRSGFRDIRAVFPPSRIYRKLGVTWESKAYLHYLYFWDWFEGVISLSPQRRRQFRRVLKLALVPDNIWISAKK